MPNVSRDAEDEDHTTFTRFEGLRAPEQDQDVVLSMAAFQLHAFAIRNSFKDGHPGFASDDYLNSVAAETTITAAELCTAGMWVRVQGGYEIMDDETIDRFFHMGRRSRRREQCEHELGGCRADSDNAKVCAHCGCGMESA